MSERPDAEVCRHVFDGWLADPSAMEFRGITHVLSPVHSDSVTFGTEHVHLTLGFEGFDTLAIWRRDTAPFLCLEPWTSLPISVAVPTQFADLPELVQLDPGASRRFAMRFAPGGNEI